MQTTNFSTVGWTAAGHRFRGMIRHQLSASETAGHFDVAHRSDSDMPSGVQLLREPSTSSDPADRIVYRFGGADDLDPCDPETGSVTFWPLGRGRPGEGGRRLSDRRGRIVVPSHWSRARVIEAGAMPDRVAVVAPGVDGGTFSPLSRIDREAARTTLGLADDETVLLHIGDGDEDAGLDLVLRAFARLRAAGSRVRLVLSPDDPDLAVDYERAVRQAGTDEPCLLEAGCLAAIVMVPKSLAAPDRRLLYGAADVLVAPYRACAFAFPVLDAIACGCPVVVTRGGAADDLCGEDLAWRIDGKIRRAPGEGCWIEPDLDHLTDALAEVSEGRGFDRLGFAKARLQLLREATWEASARRLTNVLVGPASDDGARPPAWILHGLAQPTGARFPAHPLRDLAVARRRARRHLTCSGPRDLSVVVQGPCLREAGEPGAPSIDEAVASIRASFPGAQVIVSTWLGSDIDGLDADDVVLSPDPGPIQHPRHLPNNVNRMVTSTANGLAAATRPFCIKTRNDLRFGTDSAIRRALHPASPTTGFERRIWVMAARIETSLRPYHPSDMMMFGRTSDLQGLWNIPEATASDLFLSDPDSLVARMTPEQALFIGYLNGVGLTVELESIFDGRWEIISGSIIHMLASFDLFDEDDIDLIMPRRFVDGKIASLCYTQKQFDHLRAEYDSDPGATVSRVYQAFHQTLGCLVDQREAVA